MSWSVLGCPYAVVEQRGQGSRFVRAVRPDQTGRFTISELPPPSYLVVALEYIEPAQEGDTEVLERLETVAEPLRLAEGEQKTVTLKLSQS